MDQHQASIDSAVKAWRFAAETYTQVFESLAKATAAHAAEGREDHDHHAFKEMVRTARAALDASKAFVLYEDRHGSAQHATVSDEEDTDEMVEENDDASERMSSDRRARRADDRKERRQRKLHKRAARLAIDATERTKQQLGLEHNFVPTVEFEDVSAEVEARLRAKDEQKVAAMKEKKRKRDSSDSVELMAVDANANRSGMKRSRVDDSGNAYVGTGDIHKKHSRDEEENVECDFYKRRKHSKD